MKAAPPHRGYRFGAFEADIDRAALYEFGRPVKLRPQSFDVLRYLIENQGRLVEKQELLEAIWGNAAVTDDSLTHCLIDIRKAIGDTRREFIRTVPRRGFIFDIPVEPFTNTAYNWKPRLTTRRAMLVSVLLITGLAVATWSITRLTSPVGTGLARQSAIAAPNSIAVLPFVDMSEGQSYAYFGDGLAEEILNSLAQSPALNVIARTSSFSYREPEHEVTTIARELNVANVLEGSVRVENGKVRITAQLVNGSDGMHLWSESFDRNTEDMLDMQTDIARTVTQVLTATLPGTPDRSTLQHVNGEAHDLYMQARFLFHRRAHGDVRSARELYLRAVELEPEFARAWAGLAGTYVIEHWESGGTDRALLQSSKVAAEQAVAMDPGLAEGWIRLGFYYSLVGDRGAFNRHLDRAIAADPDDPLLLAVAAGKFAADGDLKRAIDFQQRALERNPLSFVDRGNLSFYLYAAGRYEDAIRENRRAKLIQADTHGGNATVEGYALIKLGRYSEALEEIDRWPDGPDRDAATAMARLAMGHKWRARRPIYRLQKNKSLEAYLRLAELRAFCEEVDESFQVLADLRDTLIRTETDRTFEIEFFNDVRWSPFLAPIREDPRWQPWLNEIRDLTIALGDNDWQSLQ